MNDQPLFTGPLYLHTQGTFESYYMFFSHLALKLSDYGSNIIFGTGNERSLVNVIKNILVNLLY